MSRRMRFFVQMLVMCAGWALFSLTWDANTSELSSHGSLRETIAIEKPLTTPTTIKEPQLKPQPTKSGWEALIDLQGSLLARIPQRYTHPDGIVYGRINQKSRDWSMPFITGDGLRAVSDCLCDEESCLPNQPMCTVVFVKTDKLKDFIKSVYPNIMTSFVLVTHNSDYTSPWSDDNVRAKHGVGSLDSYSFQVKKLLDDPQVLKWFGQNPSVTHPKLVPLPIGIENRYNPYGVHVPVYKQLHDEARVGNVSVGGRDRLLFANFNPKTNPTIRGEASAAMSKLVQDNENIITFEPQSKKKKKKDKQAALLEYGRKCSQHKFCLAPPGHGIDTHRLWESFIFGCIPIVLSSHMDSIFTDLPIVIVDSWSEITVDFLNTQYDALSKKDNFHLGKLYLPYWIDAIKSAAST